MGGRGGEAALRGVSAATVAIDAAANSAGSEAGGVVSGTAATRCLRRGWRRRLRRPRLQARLRHRRPAWVLQQLAAVSGLDVDSRDGWSILARVPAPSQGRGLGFPMSVFRVMLSVSGLRTFAITASSGIPCSSGGSRHRWVASAPTWPRSGRLWAPVLALAPRDAPVTSSAGKSRPQSVALGSAKADGWFPWETPAGNGLLGGRPQLTAGIRAGSYAIECSNLRNAASIELARQAAAAKTVAPPVLR